MSQSKLQELLNLNRDDKIELVQLLWDNISQDAEFINLHPSQIEELDKRLKKINNGKAVFKSWDEVKIKYQNV
jgi:putative addiction module component (TIGR02574 family)